MNDYEILTTLESLLIPHDVIATEGLLSVIKDKMFSFGIVSKDREQEEIVKFKNMLTDPQGLFGKLPEPAQYITPFDVVVDKKKQIISIQNINYELLFDRIRDTYGEKRLELIFYRTYKRSHIKKFKKKQIARSHMKVTSLITPMFFALEVSILFSQLYKKYKTRQYKMIATEIYKKSWLSESDERKPDRLDLEFAKKLLEPKYELKSWQEQFIRDYPVWKAQLNLRGIYNSFDQGLGKTLTSLTLAMALHTDKIYIVCPNTLVANWLNEIQDYYGGRMIAFNCKNSTPPNGTRIFITNNESIKNMVPYIDTKCKSMLIVDEGHNFRNLNSSRVQELIQLREKLNPANVLPMSGTPLKGAPNELVPALLLLDPLFTIDAANIYNKCFKFDDYTAMEIVTARLGKMIYRKMKTDIIEPTKTIDYMHLTLRDPSPYIMENVSAAVWEEYNNIFPDVIKENTHILEDFEDYVRRYSIAGVTQTQWYISRICKAADTATDFTIETLHELDEARVRTFLSEYVFKNPKFPPSMINAVKEWESKLIHFDQVAKGRAIGKIYPPRRNALFSALWDEHEAQFIQMINDNIKKTVIFSQFYPVVNHIKERLEANGIGVVAITGSVNTGDRAKNLRRFKDDDSIQVIIATSQSMGTGVTLVEASQMFFFGPPWRSADFDQCCDRIYRIGQDVNVTIWNVILDTPTINLSSRMDKILNWSNRMFHSAMDTTIVE